MTLQYSSNDIFRVILGYLRPVGCGFPLDQYLEKLGLEIENGVQHAKPNRQLKTENRLLTVSTWNVRDTSSVDSLVHALQTVPDLKGSDVVALQEVSLAMRGEELAERTGFNCVYSTELVGFNHDNKANPISIMLLSRHTISDYQVLRLDDARYFTNDHGRVLGASTAIRGKIVKDGKEFVVYSLHIELRANQFRKKKHIKRLLDDISRYEGTPVIIAGDFNFIFDMLERPSLKILSQNAFLDPFGGHKRTTLNDSYGQILRSALDRIMSRGIAPVYTTVQTDVTTSDHFPVTALYRL